MQYQLEYFSRREKQKCSTVLSIYSEIPFNFSHNAAIRFCLLKMGNGGTQSLPLYRYDKHGNRLDNITDWGLKGFREHYGDESIR